MKGKQIAAGLLAALLLVGLVPAGAAGPEGLTRGEACAMLVEAADDYNPGVTADDILKGDENGGRHEDEIVTRAEALVMLERAFGDLPDPKGDSARRAYPATSFTDLPAWAEQELSDVFTAGIVAGTSVAAFSPNTPVTEEQLNTFIRRVYALEGSNPKDDFYAAVNKNWLETAQIPNGYPYNNNFAELTIKVNEQVAGIISKIASGTPKAGSHDEKIKNLYDNALDWDARDAAGIDPIKPYLEAVDAAQSLDELMEVHNKASAELGASMLMGFGMTVDSKDATKYILTFAAIEPSLSKDTYTSEASGQKDAYLKYITTLFTLGGDTAEEAAAHAEAVFEVEKALAAVALNQQDYYDVDKTYNIVTMDELEKLFPHVDVPTVLSSIGFPAQKNILVSDLAVLNASAAYYDDDHLDTLKNFFKQNLLMNYGGALSRDFMDAANQFQQDLYGTQGTLSDKEIAAQIVQGNLEGYLGEAYVKQYFSAEAKANVEQMVEEIRSVFKLRIQALDWMSETTKKKAVEKLEAMTVKVGYPDDWSSYADKAEVNSAAQGGSFFENIISLRLAERAKAVEDISGPVDKGAWQMSAFTVNAYYQPTSNSINFPAGILQAPFYDVEADHTENLGGIGYVIAHEITHAFDNGGAKYDKDGNATDWWTEEDYAAFQKLCEQAAAYYDGQEAVPGVTCNGAQTLSENIADLGGVACITQAEASQAEPDYKTLYETAARTWRSTAMRETTQYLTQTDVHAPDKLRGSRALQSCDEFYTTFDIQPGDGMWLAPDQRVRIW